VAHNWVKAAVVAVVVIAAACGSDDGDSAAGTWTHVEEGTIVLDDNGDGSITQSSDPVVFTWSADDDQISFVFDGDDEPAAIATLDGDSLTFRSGDFSGDDPVTFTRSD